MVWKRQHARSSTNEAVPHVAREMVQFEKLRLAAAMDSAVNKGHPVNRRNWRVRSKILGLRPEPCGLNAPPLHISRQTGERTPTARTCGMWRISVPGGRALLSRISRPGVDNGPVWLLR